MKPFHRIVLLAAVAILLVSVMYSLSVTTEETASLDIVDSSKFRDGGLRKDSMLRDAAHNGGGDRVESSGGGNGHGDGDEDGDGDGRGNGNGNGEVTFNSKALAITHQDSFLIYEYPSIMLLVTHNFTFEVWYRTPHQPRVTIPVAIFSNDRDSFDSEKYGRWFRVMLEQTGKVSVDYHAMDTMKANGERPAGRIESQVAIDDDQWHHIAVVRSRAEQRLRLFIDFKLEGEVEMPIGIDIMDQEQRTVFGGGNNRGFRECYLDELRLWKVAREITDGTTCVRCSNPNLVAYFDFEEDAASWRAVVRDCSQSGGHALRTGDELIKGDPFTAGAPRVESCPNTSRVVHASRRSPPDTDTVLLTSLYWRCSGDGDSMFDTGRIYQFEAYIGPLWLDVNRLNAKMVVMVGCLDEERIALYTTPNVQFVKAEPYDRDLTLHCHPVIQRFLVFNEYIKSGALDYARYIAMLDLRDSRMNHSPKPYWDAHPKVELVLQRINGMDLVCGGFQAGKLKTIGFLLQLMQKAIYENNCVHNDQDILNLLYHTTRLGSLVLVKNEGIINLQQIRVFNKPTAFEHAIWWRTFPDSTDASPNPFAYPSGIP